MKKNKQKTDNFSPIAPYRENDLLKLLVGEFTRLGTCISFVDGIPIEILGGIPGEIVEVKIIKVFPEKIVSIVNNVFKESKYRVTSPCEKFLECTGCQFQHIDYSYQLVLKRQFIADELSKYSSLNKTFIDETIPSPKKFNYRNHSRFTVRNKNSPGEVGYINSFTRKFIKIEECILMTNKINIILDEIQNRMENCSQVSIRSSVKTDSFLVQPNLCEKDFSFDSGQKYYYEEVIDRKYRVASPSFFQVNILQLENIINFSREILKFDGQGTLVDAYSGVGIFASQFSKDVKKVISIEESASAVLDATISSSDLQNIEYVQKKTEIALLEIKEVVDYLILDPPRIGCQMDVLESVIRIKPKKILMISCDPESMMRDLDFLVSKELFKIQSIIPFDMFPQTRHIESVALIHLND